MKDLAVLLEGVLWAVHTEHVLPSWTGDVQVLPERERGKPARVIFSMLGPVSRAIDHHVWRESWTNMPGLLSTELVGRISGFETIVGRPLMAILRRLSFPGSALWVFYPVARGADAGDATAKILLHRHPETSEPVPLTYDGCVASGSLAGLQREAGGCFVHDDCRGNFELALACAGGRR